MSRWACQSKAMIGLGCVGEITSRPEPAVVCPRPRRVSLIKPSRLLYFNNHQSDLCDTIAGTELLEIIRNKESAERADFQMASSPPFFSGSPPCRASNPIIQDEHFCNYDFNVIPPFLGSQSPLPQPPQSLSSTSSRMSGSCVPVNFGHKPAPVRIEGFNCRGTCSISAVA